MKSPLRYPGGKSRAVKTLMALIPPGISELMSPFFGGGSIELACASRGIQVYGYDVFLPLVSFWQQLLNDPETLAAAVQDYFPLTRDRFYELQKLHRNELSDLQGILFFVLNRASFSGTTLSGGCSELSLKERFTQSSIDRLRKFSQFDRQNLTVNHADFQESLNRHPDTFLYLDPPYLIESMLYGNRGSTHRGFDHEGLAQRLRERSGWILSYNNCPEILDLYQGYEVLYPQWSYGMSSNKISKEILIINY